MKRKSSVFLSVALATILTAVMALSLFPTAAFSRYKDSVTITEKITLDSVQIQLDYYAYGEKQLSDKGQTLNVVNGTKINFNDPDSLAKAKVTIPEGYTYMYATSAAVSWTTPTEFTITDAFSTETPIEVHVIKNGHVPLLVQYWDRSKPNADNTGFEQIGAQGQEIAIKKSTKFDFADPSTLTNAGITMPSDYKYIASHHGADNNDTWASNTNWFHDSYTVNESTPVWSQSILDVYMAPTQIRDNIKVELQNADGGVIQALTMNDGKLTHNGGTCQFTADGKLTITLADLQKMFSGGNSFTIYIRNGSSYITIGSVASGTPSATVDYFKIYQEATMLQYAGGYGLVNPNMELVIKMWW